MSKTETIKSQCKQLKLSAIADNLDDMVRNAQDHQVTFLDFVNMLMQQEINHRMEKDKQRRQKNARLPLDFNLDLYDHSFSNGIGKQQLAQLRELGWLEQNFNVILMGPSGTGKTYIAAGLCFDAVEQGYRAYFKSMEDLIGILRKKDITRTAAAEYKRILKSHLLVIDDIMMFPVNQEDAVTFFNLINELHDKTSVIITTNKSPKQWTEVLKDTVLTTALLDRILYRCEVIKLEGNSYRMENRQTIFKKDENLD
ncbi:AAA family ATPase [Candidatus Poribacteria bacterium]|nr:AAA family ATPase [Candidatus Poribacteria bacterium]